MMAQILLPILNAFQRPMITAATALTGTHEHIDGYAALHMDPNAEGGSVARSLCCRRNVIKQKCDNLVLVNRNSFSTETPKSNNYLFN